MYFRKLTVIAPFVLLAACGGSGSNESPSAPEATPATGAAASEASPATDAAAATSPTSERAAAVAAAAPADAPAAFAVCRACHSVEPGKNGVGPTLHGIVGSAAGEVPGYTFSPALKKSGIVWDREKLDTWLQGPMKMVPGTKMVITVPDAAKRKELIDYLETLK